MEAFTGFGAGAIVSEGRADDVLVHVCQDRD
jgi:hypothetical protein